VVAPSAGPRSGVPIVELAESGVGEGGAQASDLVSGSHAVLEQAREAAVVLGVAGDGADAQELHLGRRGNGGEGEGEGERVSSPKRSEVHRGLLRAGIVRGLAPRRAIPTGAATLAAARDDSVRNRRRKAFRGCGAKPAGEEERPERIAEPFDGGEMPASSISQSRKRAACARKRADETSSRRPHRSRIRIVIVR
jgi:hypothetical protein